MKQKTRLMIVEDEALVREAICALLEMEESITVVGQADTAEAAVCKARQLQPDVILLDLCLPDRSGLAVIAKLLHDNPTMKIVILTAYATDGEVVAAFRAGAVGFILKTQTVTEFMQAIKQVVEGQTSLSPGMAHIVLRQLNCSGGQPANLSLSDGERRVLMLVAQGFSNKEIARTLRLSPTTVTAYVSSMLSKLNLTNRTQAALYALKQGWAVLDTPLTRLPQSTPVLPVALHMTGQQPSVDATGWNYA